MSDQESEPSYSTDEESSEEVSEAAEAKPSSSPSSDLSSSNEYTVPGDQHSVLYDVVDTCACAVVSNDVVQSTGDTPEPVVPLAFKK